MNSGGIGGGGARSGRFGAGVVVLVTLSNPREKFWGSILELTPAGLSVRGLDLNSFDDFVRQVRAGEDVTPAAVFFPMHRVERIELDLRNGEIPSLCERFELKTGQAAARVLGEDGATDIAIGCSLAEAERKFVRATLAAVGDDLQRACAVLGISEEQLQRVLSFGLGERGR